MAEIHPDDLDALLDVSAADKPESGAETALAVDAGDALGPTDGSEKDTLESAGLQAELEAGFEIPVETGGAKSFSGQNTGDYDTDLGEASSGILDPEFSESSKDRSDPVEDKLIRDMEDAKKAMGELMAWKEDLRLLAMHHNTLGPYYDNWTKEANLFFRRLVIINKRLETHRKKKRA